ncbi:unnamed protein product [Prorocentrum cordatum]|uniref:Uncharacterized protein n=1 Tax=Prorocentrum cordatum TaxID=2364126 RepID=A0ABN9S249_9DINO|nr:unnamed protein product [Polarella glacialis]
MPPPGFRTGAYSPAVPLSAPGATPRLYSYGGERTPAPTPSMTPRVQAVPSSPVPTYRTITATTVPQTMWHSSSQNQLIQTPHTAGRLFSAPGSRVLAHSVQLIQLPPTVQVAEHDPAAAKS